MAKQLVIVESPAKAKTIQSFLGGNYSVLSSYGHIRDLPRKSLAIDVENGFEPTYEISADKKKRVNELKKAAKDADTIWLATDEDREGEAIAWHLQHALGLTTQRIKRIAFHEITRPAIEQAINNPREVDQNLVDAQQARRVLDRLVGYKLSPLLWRKVQPGLSAGRVQSVAVRLIVEREREIEAFEPRSSFKVTAQFLTPQGAELPAELSRAVTTQAEAEKILSSLYQSDFAVANVEQKPGTRNPAAPFTTSTLQQAAARKLGFSVRQTMTLAQRLYEAGHITYMRTDSVILAESATTEALQTITEEFGTEYCHQRSFKSRSDAQEAHEAIRPTRIGATQVAEDEGQQRLYELIRGRTLASQMAPARLDKTVVTVDDNAHEHSFIAKGEVITFAGWLKAYQDSKITDTILPEVTAGDTLKSQWLEARETLKRAPARYSEAALVRKLESMGIGRPSTYAPTISTIQDRGYIEKGDVAGEERDVTIITSQNGEAPVTSQETIRYGQDKGKLLPTQVALLVNDFLVKQFADIVDYDFTKEAEEEFDRIAHGRESWNRMIADFYAPFAKQVETAESLSREEASGANELGTDPETGKPVIARMGRYGPMLQLGHAQDDEKPKFAPVPPGKKLHEITLEEALEMLRLPRKVGTDTDGNEITASYGRYGPYVKSDRLYAPIPAEETPFTVSEDQARQILADKRQQNAQKTIAEFDKIKILNGRYGPYVTDGKKNAKIPSDTDPASLDKDAAAKILAAPKRGRKSSRSK